MPEDSGAFRPAGTGLVAKRMIDSSPQHHGVVMKLHIPILYSILPEFLQRFILSISFLSFLAPQWKQRHLILCGAYLYKFKDQAAKTPKGAPFDVESLNFKVIGNDSSMPELGYLPPGYTGVFTVSTLRRRHYYAVADAQEASVWARSVKDARQETITRNMGHAGAMPYPQSWSHFDALAKSLVKSKDRIRDRLNEYEMRETEMTMFESGPLPRGYHG